MNCIVQEKFEKNSNVIGKRIQELRKEKGITQSTIATLLGVTRGCITNWEKGTREPDLAFVVVLAEFYGVSVDYLMGRKDEKGYIRKYEKELNSEGYILDMSSLTPRNRRLVMEFCSRVIKAQKENEDTNKKEDTYTANA